ncbi:MAG: hypothetical protein FJ100_16655 [Deltaproteobacteria bacterium]|nr:hypothetical protein [Deltaproteobacteria bacterium]
MADSIDLRTYTHIDVLQPQTASFIATVAGGFLPLEGQAALVVEVAPGMSINNVTDAVLKQTQAIVGMQIVERAFGMLEVHHFDQGQIRAAGDAVLRHYGIKATDRLKPRIMTVQAITGIQGYHTMLINRMRHGDMILQGQTMLTLEVHPAGYAMLATNEAEKAANIHVLEMFAFGAFGRVWLGGDEENIAQAAAAIEKVLGAIDGRENKGDKPV